MRVIGIETSSRRGSVALVEEGRPVLFGSHEQLNAHAEAILPIVHRLMAEAGWPRTSLDRVAVGIGPGSFTGLRVGIALAQGIALGLGIPVVGVGSLQAMAAAVPVRDTRSRCPLLDARRNEVFAALYASEGAELAAPVALPRAGLRDALDRVCPRAQRLVLGEICAELDLLDEPLRGAQTDLPHAIWTAVLGATLPPPEAVEPLYVRDAGATTPSLPPSPFELGKKATPGG
jgi:tRNA threonylcarbamoyladenosine biosynthesis protein TsaB